MPLPYDDSSISDGGHCFDSSDLFGDSNVADDDAPSPGDDDDDVVPEAMDDDAPSPGDDDDDDAVPEVTDQISLGRPRKARPRKAKEDALKRISCPEWTGMYVLNWYVDEDGNTCQAFVGTIVGPPTNGLVPVEYPDQTELSKYPVPQAMQYINNYQLHLNGNKRPGLDLLENADGLTIVGVGEVVKAKIVRPHDSHQCRRVAKARRKRRSVANTDGNSRKSKAKTASKKLESAMNDVVEKMKSVKEEMAKKTAAPLPNVGGNLQYLHVVMYPSGSDLEVSYLFVWLFFLTIFCATCSPTFHSFPSSHHPISSNLLQSSRSTPRPAFRGTSILKTTRTGSPTGPR